ncbi:MAG TPA: M55 family metallopeptidase [Acidimicrobiales bacterium]|nr:M55 family metallopeptidase [Acidimicrobiales bacterium]
MKVFISVDMEGVAGVATLDQIVRGGGGYGRAQELMTQEANAAIAGAFDGGATEVLVNDSHGTMDNLLHDRLDPRARVVFGAPRAQCMAHGLTADSQVALFIGFHAAAGDAGVLAHTFSAYFREVCINGAPVSETEVNALYAASMGVPVGLVTGDDSICAKVDKVLPHASTVVVKRHEGFSAADSLHPEKARELIAAAAAEAVKNASSLPRPELPDQFVIDVELEQPTMAELVSFIPGVARSGETTVHVTVKTADDMVGFICASYYLATMGAQQRLSLLTRR